jgi:glycosyltransferase involved in cell wall biosynthesis
LRISGALPVFNEEKMLFITLPRFKDYALDELVVVLDRCTDKSEELIRKTSLPYPVNFFRLEARTWKYSFAEPVHMAFSLAKGDIIYLLSPDCFYDPKNFQIDWTDIDVASFKVRGKPLVGSKLLAFKQTWRDHFLDIALPVLKHRPNLYGVYAFRREVFEKIGIPDVLGEDQWFLKQAFHRGFRVKVFKSKTVHLRVVGKEGRGALVNYTRGYS